MVSSAGLFRIVFVAVVLGALLGVASSAIARDDNHGSGRDFIRITAADSPDPVTFTGNMVSTMAVDAYVRKVRGLGASAAGDADDCDDDRAHRDHPREWSVHVVYTIRLSRGIVKTFERDVKIQPPFEVVQLPAPRGPRFIHVPTIRIPWDGKRANGSLAAPGVYSTEVTATFIRSHRHSPRSGAWDRIIDVSDTVKGTITVLPPSNPLTLTVTAPADGAIVATTAITTTGTVAGGVAPRSLKINNQSVTLATNGSFSKSINLAEGVNTLIYQASDAASHTATRTITVTRDTTLPTVALVQPQPNSTINTATPLIRFDYSDAGSGLNLSAAHFGIDSVDRTSSFQIGAASATYQIPASSPLTNGTHSAQATLVDRAGNSKTISVSFTVQATQGNPPVITVTAPADQSIVSAASVTVTGTVTGQAPLSLKVNGTTVALGSGGAFSTSVSLVEGVNGITLVATDGVNRSTQKTVTVTRDSIAPTVAVVQPTPNSTIATATPLIRVDYSDSGTGLNLASARFLLDGQDRTSSFQVTATSATFQIPASSPLSNATHTIQATMVDRAGNSKTVTASFTVLAPQGNPPVITVTAPANQSIVSAGSVTVTGTVTGQAPLSLTVNGTTVTLGGGGAFSTPVVLQEGSNTISLIATDAVNRSTQQTITVTRDSIAPTVAVVQPTPNSTIATATPLIRVDYSDSGTGLNLASARFLLDGQDLTSSFQVTATSATFQVPASSPLSNATHTVQATLVDRAGNSKTVSASFTVQAAQGNPPVITVTAPADQAIVSAASISVTGSVTGQSPLTLKINGAAVPLGAGGSFSTSISVSEGANTILLVATDAVSRTTQRSLTVTRDSTAPTIAVVQPISNGTITTGTPLIQVDYSDSGVGVDLPSLRFLLDGQDRTSSFQVTPSSATFQVSSAAALSNGAHAVQATATDRAGNTTTVTSLFTVSLPFGGPSGTVTGLVFDISTRQPIPGARVATMDGAFVTNTDPQGRYALRVPVGSFRIKVTKAGYAAPGNRSGTAVLDRETALKTIFLTLVDTSTLVHAGQAATLSTSDGRVQIQIPACALSSDTVIQVTRTLNEALKGEPPSTLIPGYSFNVEPDLSLNCPATVTVRNDKNLRPGLVLNVLQHDSASGCWFSGSTAVVSADGQSIVGQLSHFCDVGFSPGLPIYPQARRPSFPRSENPNVTDQEGDSVICNSPGVHVKTGEVTTSVSLPSIRSLNVSRSLGLWYNSLSAKPSAVVRVEFTNQAADVPRKRFDLSLSIGGEFRQLTYAPVTELESSHNFLWNATTATGTTVPSGAYEYHAELAAVYDRVYPDGTPTGLDGPLNSGTNGRVFINNQQASPFGAGWNIGQLHRLHKSPDGSILVAYGSGRMSFFERGRGMKLLAGSATQPAGFAGDGGLATQAQVATPSGFITDTAGNIYFSDAANHRIRRVDPSGVISTFAGSGQGTNSGDGGSATTAGIRTPTTLQIDDSQNIYVLADRSVRRIASGTITTVIDDVDGFALTPAGEVYYSKRANPIGIFRRSADGSATVQVIGQANLLPGADPAVFNGDAGPADRALLQQPGNLAIVPTTGDLFFQDGLTIRKISCGGLVSTVAGAPTFVHLTAAQPLGTDVFLTNGEKIPMVAAPDGTLYLATITNGAIVRQLMTDGTIRTIAGTDSPSSFFTGAPVQEGTTTSLLPASTGTLSGIGMGPTGAVLVGVAGAAADPSYAIVAGSSDGGVEFFRTPDQDPSVLLHQAAGGYTLSARCGCSVDTFSEDGRLLTSKTRNDQVTTYEYASGLLSAIVDPVGRRTQLAYSAGKLQSVTDPANRTTQFIVDGSDNLTQIRLPDGAIWAYSYSDHLMNTETSPRGLTTRITYDTNNRVSSVQEPDTGTRQYAPSDSKNLINALSEPSSPQTSPAGLVSVTQQLDSVTDALGKTTRLRTSKEETPIDVVDRIGRRTTVSLDLFANPQFTRFADNSSQFTLYDRDHRLTFSSTSIPAVTGPVNLQVAQNAFVSFDYDTPFRFPTRISDARFGVTNITYDSHGNATSIRDPLNTTETLEWNTRGLLTRRVNRRNFATTFTYNAEGNLETVTDVATNGVRRFEYDSAGNVSRVINTRQNATTITRDLAGRITGITDALNGATTFRWDPEGLLLSTTDARSHTSSFEYNSRGRRTRSTNALAQSRTFEFDLEQRLIAVVDEKARRSVFGYDNEGRLIAMTRPGNSTYRWTYDAMDQVRTVTDPEDRVQSFLSDSRGKLVARFDGAGQLLTEALYTPAGDLSEVRDARGLRTLYTNDLLGRITSIEERATDTSSLIKSFTYDPNGNVTFKNTDNRTLTQSSYDSLDRLIAATTNLSDASETSSSFQYDTEGNLVALTTGNGATWRFAFDALNRRERFEDPEIPAHVTQFAYDATHNLVKVTDPQARELNTEYDALNRWVRRTFAGGEETAEYDATGRQTRLSNGTLVIDQTFDANDRLLTQNIPALSRLLAFDYDRSDLRTALSINGSQAYTYSWDANRRLSRITGPANLQVPFTYDILGNITRKALPNDVTLDQTWDTRGRLTRQLYTHPSTGIIEDLQYTLDAIGNIVNTSSLEGATSHFYDRRNRLTDSYYPDVSAESFGYDRSDNQISRALTRFGNTVTTSSNYSLGNRILSATNGTTLTSYNHDPSGNVVRVEETGPAGAYVTGLTWNGKNQLTSVVLPDGRLSTTQYMPASALRFQQTDPTGRQTRFLSDPTTQNLLEDIDSTNVSLVQYLHGRDVDETLAMVSSGVALSFITDSVMSTRRLIAASGTTANSYAYYAFGPSRIANETATNPLKYAGRELDSFTGFQFNRGRWYSPGSSRWLSSDPIEFAGGLNLYAYSGNNPVGNSDPSGLGGGPCRGGIRPGPYRPIVPEPLTGRTGSSNTRGGFENPFLPYEYTEAANEFHLEPIFPEYHRRDPDEVDPTLSLPFNVPPRPRLPPSTQGPQREPNPEAENMPSRDRVMDIHNALTGIARDRRTTAITRSVDPSTGDTIDLVTSSNGRLTPAQRDRLEPGEIEARGVRGERGHAEPRGGRAAEDAGLIPIGTQPSRPACVGCQNDAALRGVPLGNLGPTRNP